MVKVLQDVPLDHGGKSDHDKSHNDESHNDESDDDKRNEIRTVKNKKKKTPQGYLIRRIGIKKRNIPPFPYTGGKTKRSKRKAKKTKKAKRKGRKSKKSRKAKQH